MSATTKLILPGQTWFDTHKRSFADVPIDPKDQGIATSEFLEAAEATTTLFELLGSVAFTPVKNDMTGNIKAPTCPLRRVNVCPT